MNDLFVPEEVAQACKSVLVKTPDGSGPFTVSIRSLWNTVGAQQFVAKTKENLDNGIRKRQSVTICQTVIDGTKCPLGSDCSYAHVGYRAWETKRKWVCHFVVRMIPVQVHNARSGEHACEPACHIYR